MFWQLGKWVRLLDEGCSSEKVHPINFEKQKEIADKFIQVLRIYNNIPKIKYDVVDKLKEIKVLLSQNNIIPDDLCDELASYPQLIFNALSD